MIEFATTLLAIVVVIVGGCYVIDRTVFVPLARTKNINDDPDIQRDRAMADMFGIAAIVVTLIIVGIALGVIK